MVMPSNHKVSRRTWLGRLVSLAAAVGIPPIPAFAKPTEEKASKLTVHYRDYPKGMLMCGMCKFFEGSGMMGGGMMGGGVMGRGMMAGECQVVEGRISAMGWCDLYAPGRGMMRRG
jgi:hypothetical protein